MQEKTTCRFVAATQTTTETPLIWWGPEGADAQKGHFSLSRSGVRASVSLWQPIHWFVRHLGVLFVS